MDFKGTAVSLMLFTASDTFKVNFYMNMKEKCEQIEKGVRLMGSLTFRYLKL